MPAYDAERFAPPAPVARVALRHSETGARLPDVPMLIDCGADVMPHAVNFDTNPKRKF